VFISPGFPKDEEDSQCIPAMQLMVKALAEREDYEITILAFHYPYSVQHYIWNRVNVYPLGGANKKGISRLRLFRKAHRILKDIHREKSIDFLHSFWLGECAWVGNKVARSFSIPHSCTLMGQDVLPENVYLKRIKSYPELVALSTFQENIFLATTGKKPTFVIPWGVENIQLPPLEKQYDIVGVGWLNEVKCFDRFLLIMAALKKIHPTIKVRLIGEGTEEDNLKRQVARLELEDEVHFSGGLSREETLKHIARSRVLLHTSSFESFGMVLVEALALGTKVFSTSVGIASDLQEITTFESDVEAVSLLSDYLKNEREEVRFVPYKLREVVEAYANNLFISERK
jgi:glycosyltransferase involved in cell wall biosynthesis